MTFGEWLQKIAIDSGWNGPPEIRDILLKHDCYCSTEQVKEWLTGDPEPSYDKMRSIVSALQRELPQVDVWEHLGRSTSETNVGGSPERPAPEVQSLASALRENPHLPPGLSG